MSTPPAPRGSRAYYAAIYRTAEHDTLDDTTAALGPLWDTYGWRSTVDVMTEWICAIDYIVPRTHRYRDITGAVDFACWAPDHFLNDDAMLVQVVRIAAERAAMKGITEQESFSHATATTDRLRENVHAWLPVFRHALRIAHTTRERDAVRAVLTRGPGVKEQDWFVLRDGAVYLFQIASYPMRAARELERPVRPPDMDWMAHDLAVPPAMIMKFAEKGVFSGEC